MLMLVAASLTASAGPVSAVVVDGSGTTSAWSSSKKVERYEKPCRQKRKHNGKNPRWCKGGSKLRMHVSKQHKVTQSQATKYAGLVSPSGTKFSDAYAEMQAGGNDIHWKTFWQKGITLPGPDILYQEKHEGMAFYNGDDVWIAANHGYPDDGYHRCGVRQVERGFDVTVTDCSVNSKYMDSGSEYIQFWDTFTVAPLFRYVIPTHFDMHTNIHESGYVSFWWFDTKRD